MKSSLLVVLILFAVCAPVGRAQSRNATQAEQDGLLGHVKSIATMVQMGGAQFQPPAGPTLLIPLWCRDCEYSPDGYRTKSGQVTDGKFHGEVMGLNRDGKGRLTDVTITDAATGHLMRHTRMGPFGQSEETFYLDGKPNQTSMTRYDPSGHVTELVSFDITGHATNRALTTWNKDAWTERTTWNATGQVMARETYDAAKDEQHYTGFDESGNLALSWTFAHGKVTSFWQFPGSGDQVDNSFSDVSDAANPTLFRCHATGLCDEEKVHYVYADAAKRNPLTAEWRDANGNLLYGVYYTYRFDPAGNWTHREVSVWSTERGTRTPYELDDRLITYWE